MDPKYILCSLIYKLFFCKEILPKFHYSSECFSFSFTGGYLSKHNVQNSYRADRLKDKFFFYRCNRHWIFDCLRKIARLAQLCRYLVAWKTRFERISFGYQCRCHGVLFVLPRFCFWAWLSRNHHQLVGCYG